MEKVFDVEMLDIRYLPGANRMTQIENGGCIDAYSYEEVVCKKGDHVLINLGFSCRLPKGYDAWLVPCRSSTLKKAGLLGVTGYIDNSYNGNDDIWYASCIATRDTVIPAGARLFQWRLIKAQPEIIFNEVANLNNVNRGGFGSTGADALV